MSASALWRRCVTLTALDCSHPHYTPPHPLYRALPASFHSFTVRRLRFGNPLYIKVSSYSLLTGSHQTARIIDRLKRNSRKKEFKMMLKRTHDILILKPNRNGSQDRDRLQAERSSGRSLSLTKGKIRFPTKSSRTVYTTLYLISNLYTASFFRSHSGHGVKLTNPQKLMPRLTRGHMHPLLNTLSWRSAKLVKRNKFIFC